MVDGELERVAIAWFAIEASTVELQKFKIGYLLKEMLGHFTDKLQSTLRPDRSLWMYSAHDFQLIYILEALELYWVVFFVH